MKLINLLKSLQVEEYKDFEKFLQSPFFKSSEQYLKFFKLLRKEHPSFDLEKADLQEVYRRCFGPHSLNDTKLYNLMSGLCKQIEQYFVVRMVLSPDNEQISLFDQLLVKSLSKRNMGTYFRKEALHLIEETMKIPRKQIENYHALYSLHREIYYNPDTPKYLENPPHIKLAAEHLDIYYCMAKLRCVAEMKSRERIYHFQYEFPLLEAVLAHSAAPELLESYPLLSIYHHLVKLYQRGIDEPGFREVMNIYVNKYPFLPKMEQVTLLPHLINSGIVLLKRGGSVERELLSLYKLAMDAYVLLDGNRITHGSFINIVGLAGLCGEFDWAYGFIEQFSPYLEEGKRQPSIDLATAALYYSQGQLDEAQTCLKPEIFQIPLFDLMGRALLIRIVFDRYITSGRDYEFLMAQVNTFERYVQTKALSLEKRTSELNWIKFVRRIAVVKFELVEVPEEKKKMLKRSLQPVQPMIHKKWLQERIEWL